MEGNYKSFMDKQHPSEDLLAETISRVKMLSEEQKLQKWNLRKWRYGIIIFAVICLILTGVWKWNMQVVYPDLVTEFSRMKEVTIWRNGKKNLGRSATPI